MNPQQDGGAELEAALAEGRRLRDEVKQLKDILARNSIPLPESENKTPTEKLWLPAPAEIANVAAPADKGSKVALFRLPLGRLRDLNVFSDLFDPSRKVKHEGEYSLPGSV